MQKLHIHNSLTGQKEPFTPADPAHVRLYACGPTVYNYAHIGNARMAVVFDLLAGVLRHLYPKVTYVSNITDVDDKIMAAAKETGEDIALITRKYEKIYNDDMAALGVRAPDVQPRATEHIPEMIAQIGQLIARGHAYAAQGHVMFNVPSYPAYGRLSGRSRDEQIAGARVEVAPYKKDPADFVLWKPSSPDQPGWGSPWGFGRPGWHIECSAMSEKYLSPLPFDIHGGGADLKFPHHENEIAQSCCAHGHETNPAAFARHWVHNGFVTVSGEKMSKSIGNIRLVHDLLKHYPGEVLRLTLLSAHYRAPLDLTEDTFRQSHSILDRLYRALKDIDAVEPDSVPPPDDFMEALLDDLNTPKAMTILNALAKEASGDGQRQGLRKGAFIAAAGVLGLLQQNPGAWLGYGGAGGGSFDSSAIEKLLAERQQAKKEKNFARADEIRNDLAAQGIAIEDTPQGSVWRKAAN